MNTVTPFTKARSRHGPGVLQLLHRGRRRDRLGGISFSYEE